MVGKIIRVALVSLSVLTFSTLLPQLYKKSFRQNIERPEVVYSEVLDDFLLLSLKRDSLNSKYITEATDSKGNRYNSKEINTLTPIRSFKQLEYEQRFPDTILGTPVTTQKLMDSFTFPSFLGASGTPSYPFFWMFESDSSKMSVPEDIFRISKSGIEFLNVQKNRVDKEKSKLFNDALSNLGFIPPAKNINGVTSLSKSEDEGYFIIDSNENLFHLKMVSAMPKVHKVSLPNGVVPFHMNCMSGSAYYGYFYDTNKNIYLMQKPNYGLIKLPIEDYKEFGPTILVESNMFYSTFTLSSASKVKKYILNPDFSLKNSYEQSRAGYVDSKAYMYEAYLFPMVVSASKERLDFEYNSPKKFLTISTLLFILLFLLKLSKKRSLLDPFNVLDYLFVLTFGIAGFISVLLFPNRK